MAGRPLKFKSVEELQEKIDNFFKTCDEKKEPYTMTGLALALDTSRNVLLTYENKDEYSNSIKKARNKCEAYAEKCLFSNKASTAGVIFNMKNNYGWADKNITEHQGDISIHITEDESKL